MLTTAVITAVLALVSNSSAAQTAVKNKASAASAASGSAFVEELASSANAVDTWRNYALTSLKTNFSWASDPGEALEPPSIFNRGRSSLARTPAMHMPASSLDDPTSFHVALQSSRIADTPLYASAEASSLLPDASPGLRRTIISPSLTQRFGNAGFFKVSAILASQRFNGIEIGNNVGPNANWNNAGYVNVGDAASAANQLRSNENSVGAGARFDIGTALTDQLSWQAGYQSRVGMDSFGSYRGIFGQAGSFDIPPSANIGLGAMLTPNLRLGLGMERVMYSQVTPFASYTLPPLARAYLELGNHALAWENLDVYSVDLTWRNALLGDFSLRYSTREQPLPSWIVLQQILQPNLTSHNLEFDFARAIGAHSNLRFAAVYAPIQLLGAPSFNADNNFGSNQLRLEAFWSTAF
jgi:hypothetical protein